MENRVSKLIKIIGCCQNNECCSTCEHYKHDCESYSDLVDLVYSELLDILQELIRIRQENVLLYNDVIMLRKKGCK